MGVCCSVGMWRSFLKKVLRFRQMAIRRESRFFLFVVSEWFICDVCGWLEDSIWRFFVVFFGLHGSCSVVVFCVCLSSSRPM